MQPIIRALLASVALALTVPNLSANPNHLEPITQDDDGYHQAVFEALIGRERGELWEICEPSFQVEYAVILRSKAGGPKGESILHPSRRLKWYLEVATAAEQIWHVKQHGEGSALRMEIEIRKDVKVKRKQIEIEQPLALELQKTWLGVLARTRSAKEDDPINDGIIYQFYAFPYFGETHSPDSGLPAKFVKLGSQLEAAIQSKPASRKSLLSECLRTARALQVDTKAYDATSADATHK